MTTLEVNFLSFGKRERILKRTHRKYISYIFVILILISLLYRNILTNRNIYNDLTNLKQSTAISQINQKHQNNIESILLLIDNVKPFTENIVYNSNYIGIDVRIADKKYIYSIVDNLRQHNLDIKSYGYVSENDGLYLYKIDIGV